MNDKNSVKKINENVTQLAVNQTGECECLFKTNLHKKKM